jgi:hypothetical protein
MKADRITLIILKDVYLNNKILSCFHQEGQNII